MKGHLWPNDFDVRRVLYQPDNLRVLEPRIAEHRRNVRVDLPHQPKQDRAVLAARKRNADRAVERLVPSPNALDALLDLFIEG
jgi:hypothetical protein